MKFLASKVSSPSSTLLKADSHSRKKNGFLVNHLLLEILCSLRVDSQNPNAFYGNLSIAPLNRVTTRLYCSSNVCEINFCFSSSTFICRLEDKWFNHIKLNVIISNGWSITLINFIYYCYLPPKAQSMCIVLITLGPSHITSLSSLMG